MRSFASTLLFEQSLDFVPNTSPEVYNALNAIFNPTVTVVIEDCNTLLGEKIDLTLDLIGREELETDTLINRQRLNQASDAGQSYLRIRSLSTCIAQGGICGKCYAATFHGTPPAVNTRIQIQSEFPLQTEHIVLPTGTTETTLLYGPDEYDRVYVYSNGFKRTDGVGYTVSGKTITLIPGIGAEPGSGGAYGTLTIRYIVDTRAPFVYWLGNRFSGSLIGLAALPSRPLPIRRSLHASVLPVGEVEYLVSRVMSSPLTPEPIKAYLPKIADPFERAVFVGLLSSIYLS